MNSLLDWVTSATLAHARIQQRTHDLIQLLLRREVKMVRMFIRHVVGNYRVWRRAYNAFERERRGMGVVGHTVYRAVASPNEVTVSHDFASIRRAKAFAGSLRLREVMKGAGVMGKPTIWFVKPT
jgi:hypothetical protein